MTAASPAFRANLADLRSALDRIAPAAPARPPHPILGAVVVDVGDDGAVRLSAFDLQVSVETVVEGALAKAPGRAAVSRADLLRIVKAVCKGETKKTWSGWDVEITATIEHRGAAAPTEVPTHQVHAEVSLRARRRVRRRPGPARRRRGSGPELRAHRGPGLGASR